MIKIHSFAIDLFDEQESNDSMKIPHVIDKDYGQSGVNEKYVTDGCPIFFGCEIMNEDTVEESLSERRIYLAHNIIYPNFFNFRRH